MSREEFYRCVELFSVVMEYSTPRTLERLAATNKTVAERVHHYKQGIFKLAKTIGRTFTEEEYEKLRKIMAVTGAVFSGSTGLEFFTRGFLPDQRPLDLIVNKHGALTICLWLIDIGFQGEVLPGDEEAHLQMFQPEHHAQNVKKVIKSVEDAIYFNVPDESYFRKGEDGVLLLLRFSRPGSLVVPVQVTIAMFNPLQVVLSFKSTAMMNIIDCNTAYCLFPELTIDQSRHMRIRGLGTYSAPWKDELATVSDSAFQQIGIQEALEATSGMAVAEIRSDVRVVGDAMCYSIGLGEPIAEGKTVAGQGWRTNKWKITRKSAGGHSRTVLSLSYDITVPGGTRDMAGFSRVSEWNKITPGDDVLQDWPTSSASIGNEEGSEGSWDDSDGDEVDGRQYENNGQWMFEDTNGLGGSVEVGGDCDSDWHFLTVDGLGTCQARTDQEREEDEGLGVGSGEWEEGEVMITRLDLLTGKVE